MGWINKGGEEVQDRDGDRRTSLSVHSATDERVGTYYLVTVLGPQLWAAKAK